MSNVKLMKVPEAAAALSLSPKCMWAWIARKEIGVHRIGRNVRISHAEVERILAEGYEPARGVRGAR